MKKERLRNNRDKNVEISLVLVILQVALGFYTILSFVCGILVPEREVMGIVLGIMFFLFFCLVTYISHIIKVKQVYSKVIKLVNLEHIENEMPDDLTKYIKITNAS